ncbi:hypothetical protein F4819DRAFT_487364 [Hypoxylon fuscum]|nr:hypothetical protein F4819DRAFT_487364 [Hypoxylon fuscum]
MAGPEGAFKVEFLEIAPSPISVDQIFFLFLRGKIPPSKKKDSEHLDDLLTTTTLSITLSEGKHEGPKTYTVPLRTTAFADVAHLSVRNATGAYVDHINSSGCNDILTNYTIQ